MARVTKEQLADSALSAQLRAELRELVVVDRGDIWPAYVPTEDRVATALGILRWTELVLRARAGSIREAQRRSWKTSSAEFDRSAELVSELREQFTTVELIDQETTVEAPATTAEAQVELCGSQPLGPPSESGCRMVAGHHADGSACRDVSGATWPHPSAPAPERATADVEAYLRGDTDVLVSAAVPEPTIEPARAPAPEPTVEQEGPMAMQQFTIIDPTVEPVRPAALTFAEIASSLRPHVARPTRSVSQVEQWSGCGLKYRLARRTRGVEQRPGWALVGGIAIHNAIERIEHMLSVSVSATPETSVAGDIDSIWRHELAHAITEQTGRSPNFPTDTWHEANRGREGYTWWLHEGPDMLARYLTWRRNWTAQGYAPLPIRLDNPTAFEISLETTIGEVPMAMRIDAVWHNVHTGDVVVLDVKSGARTPSDRFQLKTYVMGIGPVLGVPLERISSGYLMLREGALSGLHGFGPDDEAEVMYRVSVMDVAEANGVHIPSPGPFCSACSVAHVCPIMASRQV